MSLPARWYLLIAMVAPFLTVSTALGQVEDDVEPDVPAAEVVQNNFMVADENFEQWIFNNGSTAAQSRTKFETILSLQVEDIDRVCTLTDAQKRKLRLAGQGDLKRFFDLVDEKLRKFKAVKNDQQKFNEIWQEIQPLQTKIASGFFGNGSFYQRTIANVLNPEQVSKFRVADQDRRSYHFAARLDLAISLLDNNLGLREEQRDQFFKTLQDEIPIPNVVNQQDYYFIMYCLAQISESKLKPIFDEPQWTILTGQFQQAVGLKDYLKTNGYELPTPKDPPKPAHRMPPRRPADTKNAERPANTEPG